MAQHPVLQPSEPATRLVFAHGEGRDVSDAPSVEIAGCRMMRGMVLPPDVVWGQRQHAQHAPDPVARLPVLQE